MCIRDSWFPMRRKSIVKITRGLSTFSVIQTARENLASTEKIPCRIACVCRHSLCLHPMTSRRVLSLINAPFVHLLCIFMHTCLPLTVHSRGICFVANPFSRPCMGNACHNVLKIYLHKRYVESSACTEFRLLRLQASNRSWLLTEDARAQCCGCQDSGGRSLL